IPTGIDAGLAEVEVSHPGGRDATTVEVERHGVLVDRAGGRVHVIGLGRGTEAQIRASFPVDGVVDAAISFDGQIAYPVANPAGAAATSSLHVIALTAAGGPKLLRQIHLPLPRGSALATAQAAPVAAVAGSGKFLVLDLGVPRTPSLGEVIPLVGDAR